MTDTIFFYPINSRDTGIYIYSDGKYTPTKLEIYEPTPYKGPTNIIVSALYKVSSGYTVLKGEDIYMNGSSLYFLYSNVSGIITIGSWAPQNLPVPWR